MTLELDSRGILIIKRSLVLLGLALSLLFVCGFIWFWFLLDAPFGEKGTEPVIVSIPPGTSFQDLSVELEQLGLVRHAIYIQWRYRIAARLGIAGAHQAGRYFLETGMSPSQILKSITSPGDAQRIYTTLVILPGYTSSQIAAHVQESHLAHAVDVENAIVALASEYPILQNKMGLQGYLFPDTYKIEAPFDETPQTSKLAAESIVRTMADKFFSVLDEIEPSWRRLTEGQLHERIVLASIVEREYRIAEEAKKIAAVFNNRLKKGMALQSCATVVYTIEETRAGRPFRDEFYRFKRRIFEQYLEIDSPYNTYLYSSLPPAPIAITGRVALEAVFNPAKIDSLFFVVKNPAKGTHVFSRNYSDHLSARDDYIKTFVIKE